MENIKNLNGSTTTLEGNLRQITDLGNGAEFHIRTVGQRRTFTAGVRVGDAFLPLAESKRLDTILRLRDRVSLLAAALA